MSIDFDEIPTLDSAGRLGRAPAADSPFVGAFAPPTSPTMDQLSGLGLGLGERLADSLRARLFPNSMLSQLRDAAAKTYTTFYDCAGVNYDGTCQQPCFGPEPQYMSPFYCASCAEQQADPNQNPAYCPRPFNLSSTHARSLRPRPVPLRLRRRAQAGVVGAAAERSAAQHLAGHS